MAYKIVFVFACSSIILAVVRESYQSPSGSRDDSLLSLFSVSEQKNEILKQNRDVLNFQPTYRKIRQADFLFPDDPTLEDRYANAGFNRNPMRNENSWERNIQNNRRNPNQRGTNNGNVWDGNQNPSWNDVNGNWVGSNPDGGSWNNQNGGNWNNQFPGTTNGGNQRTTTTTTAPTTSSVMVTASPVCLRRCVHLTPEYNPVCGSNGQSFSNLSQLNCSQECGVLVGLARYGKCRSSDLDK